MRRMLAKAAEAARMGRSIDSILDTAGVEAVPDG
jgi:hypothetical protein